MKKVSNPINSNELLHRLRQEGMSALKTIYQQYRQDFLLFARRYGADDELILDVYQDAIIAFYENVTSGKIKELNSQVKTYIFSIGKFILFNKIKRKGRIVEAEQIPEKREDLMSQKIELNHQQKMMKRALDKLSGKCRQLLILFYYRRYSIEAIMHEMGYGSENVTKSSKARCMKALKTILKKDE